MPKYTNEVERVVGKYNKKKSKLTHNVCEKLLEIVKRQSSTIKGCNDTIIAIQETRDNAESVKCEAEQTLRGIV